MRCHFPLLALASSLASTNAAYTLVDKFDSSNWFNSFGVQALHPDPTNGFVNYLTNDEAVSNGLYRITSDSKIWVGVDNKTTLDPSGTGRDSVRLASNNAYKHGVFIFDFEHIPGTACGSWPAFWMLGAGVTWPQGGEIDIIEGINHQTKNQVTVHSASGCNVTIESKYGQTGTWGSATPCNAGAGGGYNGCTVFSPSSQSYGTGFNAAGGGIYTMHWTGSGIKVWFFSRAGSIPSDITNGGTPNPNVWGTPLASFAGCDFDHYFQKMQILLNIDFCGSWAGAQWSASSACSPLASSCQKYVAANPQAYDESYFLINSIRVYSG